MSNKIQKKSSPIFQKKAKNYTEQADYIAALDELMKRNKGQMLLEAQDVGSNVPYRVGGKKVYDPYGLGDSPSQVNAQNFSLLAGGSQPSKTQRAYQQMPQAPSYESGYSGNGEQQQSPFEPGSIDEFIYQINQTYYPRQQTRTQEQRQQLYGQTGSVYGIASMQDGGILYNDNKIRYQDGTIRDYIQGNAYAVASMPDGSVRYSDGSIRRVAKPQEMTTQEESMPIASLPGNRVLYSDGTVRYGDYIYQEGAGKEYRGVSGLSETIFGNPDQYITQRYGNYNPSLYAGGYHIGTDFRTRNLEGEARNLKLPFDAKVVKIIRENSGSPYGNSVMLELPNGYMIRLSHLSAMGNYNVGDTISAHEYIGTPGTTGNSTAEHLDVETYNNQGQRINPQNFVVESESVRVPVPGQGQPGEMATTQDIPNFDITLRSLQNLNKPQQAYQAPAQTPSRMIDQTAQRTGQVLSGATQQAASGLAKGIEKVNPTGQYGLGVTETLMGNPEGARQEQLRTMESIKGLPELQTTELSREQGTNPLRQLAGNILDVASTPLKKIGVPDFGISEAVAGGRTVNTGTNLAPGAYAYDQSGQAIASKQPTPKDYANVLGENVKSVGQEVSRGLAPAKQFLSGVGQTISRTAQGALNKAGEGLQNLGQGVNQAVGMLPGVQSASLYKRAIGEGGNQATQFAGTTAALESTATPNDIRDPFFKLGGSETYKNYLTPNADTKEGGALSLNLFTPSFYQEKPEQIVDVFGSTQMGNQALGRFQSSETQKYPLYNMAEEERKNPYMQGMDYGEWGHEGEYRKQVDEYNKQVGAYNDQIRGYLDSLRSYNNQVQTYLSSIPGMNKGTTGLTQLGEKTPEKMDFSGMIGGLVRSVAQQADIEDLAKKTYDPFAKVSNLFTPFAAVVPQAKSAIQSFTSSVFARPGIPSKPQMSVQPKPTMSTPSKPQMSVQSKPAMSTPSKPQMSVQSRPSSPSTPSKPQMSVQPSVSKPASVSRPTPAPAPTPARTPAPAPARNYTPAPAKINYTPAKPQMTVKPPTPAPAPTPAKPSSSSNKSSGSNIVKTVVSFIKRLFGR